MISTADFDALIEPYHQALGAMINGNPSAYKEIFSQRDDVTLGNPFGPFGRGRAEVEERLELAASKYSGGELGEFETVSKQVTPELAYLVEVERCRAKVGGRGGGDPRRPQGHQHLSTRGRRLEARASARRPDNRLSTGGVGDPSPSGVRLELAKRSRRPHSVSAPLREERQPQRRFKPPSDTPHVSGRRSKGHIGPPLLPEAPANAGVSVPGSAQPAPVR
jgi:hypothetical protein